MKRLTVAMPARWLGTKKQRELLGDVRPLREELEEVVMEAIGRTHGKAGFRLMAMIDGPARIEFYSTKVLPGEHAKNGALCTWDRRNHARIAFSDIVMDGDDDYRLALAIHEIGHALTLDHVRTGDSIMHADLRRPGEDRIRPEWGHDDVRRLKARFG
jgi:hypothetical protein